jgi:hypothetical protein
MKLNSLLAVSALSFATTLSFAQSAPAVAPVAPAVVQPAPAAAVDNTSKAEVPPKKHAKKHAHKVSAKKHKAGKHKKKVVM